MDNITTYICEPQKNVNCRGRFEEGWCGVECKLTLHEEFAKDAEAEEKPEEDG